MSYIDSERYTAWHIPCYAHHNCPRSNTNLKPAPAAAHNEDDHLRAGHPFVDVGDLAPKDLETFVISGFLWCIVIVSLTGILSVGGALCVKRGIRRPLTHFFLSLLTGDILMIFIVIPLQAVEVTTRGWGIGPHSCVAWMYSHLVSIAAKSWTIMAFAMMFQLEDGRISAKRSAIVTFWVWTVAFVLPIPAVITGNVFLDVDTCAIIPDNYSMTVYVATLIFLLPACLLSPIFNRVSGLRSKMFHRLPLCQSEPPMDSDTADFPRSLYFLCILNIFCWFLFFLILLVSPILVDPLPQEILLFVAWIGYAQSAIGPILMGFLSDRVYKTVTRVIMCKEEKRQSAAASTESFFRHQTESTDDRPLTGRCRDGLSGEEST